MPDPKEQEMPLQDAEPWTEPKPFETPHMAEDQVPMAISTRRCTFCCTYS